MSALADKLALDGEPRAHPKLPGVTITRGFTLGSYGPLDRVAREHGMSEREEWCDYPYRIVWVNEQTREILTYCEGDIDLATHADEAAFKAHVDSTAKFYATH